MIFFTTMAHPKGVQPPWLKKTCFQKGVVQNPHGKNITPKAMKVVARLTQKELAEMASLLLRNNMIELKRIMNDEINYQYWQSAFASVAVKAYEKGDMHTINLILDRIIGKVKDVTEVQLPRPTIIQIEQDRQIVLGATFNAIDQNTSEGINHAEIVDPEPSSSEPIVKNELISTPAGEVAISSITHAQPQNPSGECLSDQELVNLTTPPDLSELSRDD